MNEVLDVINRRRSVRFYSDKSVDIEFLNSVVDAGNNAPTGSGQSWRFVVITRKDLLDKLKDLSIPFYKKFMQQMPDSFKQVRKQIDAMVDDPVFYSAPAVIYVLGSGRTSDIDCSMVCQNMMLAAESLGLNSCYVYFGQLVLNHPEIQQLIKVSDGEKVYGPILIGYGDKNQSKIKDKKKPETIWM